MGMLGKREFTERYGDPAKFVFKGQYYDAGQHSETHCTVCGHIIRYVCILKNPENRSVPLGSCCFGYFEKWNKDLFIALCAASVLNETVKTAIQADTKLYNEKGDTKHRLTEWRRLKRQAIAKVSAFKKESGSTWLPKPLFDLQAEAKLKPGKSSRWFDLHIPVLREKVAALTVENPKL